MRQSNKRGFSIAELIVSMSIFSLALAGIFFLFHFSYRSFHSLQSRQGLQAEMLRIKALLKSDFELSHLRSVTADSHELSCLIIDDWYNRNNYYADSFIPRWNRYAYYTNTPGSHNLFRSVLSQGQELPLQRLSNPDQYQVTTRQLLTENLSKMNAKLNFDSQDVTIEILLAKDSTARATGLKESTEVFEGVFRFIPANTHPRL